MSGGNLHFPRLQFTVQQMEQSIIAGVMEQNDELIEMIRASMKDAVKQIKTQLNSQVQAALGKVMNDAVQQAAQIASEGLADELAEAMSKQVRNIVSKRMKS